MDKDNEQAKSTTPKHRWFQFGLRTMLVLTALTAVWLGLHVKRVEDQKRAVRAIRAAGGGVIYDLEGDEWLAQEWLIDLVGMDYIRNVDYVSLNSSQDANTSLQYIGTLFATTELDLMGSGVTDDGMRHLAMLHDLEVLKLSGTSVTDDGLDSISQLSNLKTLWLDVGIFGDNGMSHLKNLEGLEYLSVSGNRNIGDAGAVSLRPLMKMKHLNLNVTGVGDAGMEGLSGMKDMEELYLEFCPVTDAGIRHLAGMKNLTTLHLTATAVGDGSVDVLSSLSKLVRLEVRQTNISAEGIADLKHALPACMIMHD